MTIITDIRFLTIFFVTKRVLDMSFSNKCFSRHIGWWELCVPQFALKKISRVCGKANLFEILG